LRIRKIIVLVAVLSLFIVSPVGAVTSGQPDYGNHPYVGLIVFFSSTPYVYDNTLPTPLWRCSGALISDHVFLTAAHCVTGPTPDFARIWFDPAPQGQPACFPLTCGPDHNKYPFSGYDAAALTASDLIPMPDYGTANPANPKSSGLPGFDYHDVAIVRIDSWTTGVPVTTERALLPSAGYVDALPMKTQVAIVGYGVYDKAQVPGSAYPPPGQDAGYTPPYLRWYGRLRQYAPSQLVQSNDVISAEFLKLTANPGQGKGGTCFGDSGGPILDGNTVLGVNSFVSNVNCSGVTYSNRVDTTDALTFITGYLS